MQTKQPPVRALERGLDILECLQATPGPLSLSGLAEGTGLSPSTAMRILSTLEKRGFVRRDERTKQYALGPRTRAMREKTLLEMLFAMAAEPMRVLNRTFGESISVFVPRNDKRVCVRRVESSHPLRPVVNVGDSLPLSLGASGRVLCAWLEEQGALDIAALSPPPDRAALKRTLEQGYAASFGEREAGTYAVSAPVFAPQGGILAALALAGPIVRFRPDILGPMSEAIKTQAGLITRSLDWKGAPGPV